MSVDFVLFCALVDSAKRKIINFSKTCLEFLVQTFSFLNSFVTGNKSFHQESNLRFNAPGQWLSAFSIHVNSDFKKSYALSQQTSAYRILMIGTHFAYLPYFLRKDKHIVA